MIPKLQARWPLAVNDPYPSNPTVSGQVRWNSSQQSFEVMSDVGHTGQPTFNHFYSRTAEVYLEEDALEILGWARQKMEQEKELERLCAGHPAVAEMRDRFVSMVALVRSGGQPA